MTRVRVAAGYSCTRYSIVESRSTCRLRLLGSTGTRVHARCTCILYSVLLYTIRDTRMYRTSRIPERRRMQRSRGPGAQHRAPAGRVRVTDAARTRSMQQRAARRT